MSDSGTLIWSALSLSLVLGSSARLRADSMLRSPASIGRAGTSLVSSDSALALRINPGATIRRSQARLILSTAVADQNRSVQSLQSANSPTLINRAGPSRLPVLAYHHGDSEGWWVLGAVVSQHVSTISWPTPTLGQPIDDISRLFPHRYSGTGMQFETRALTIGGALRVGESLGFGVSATVSQHYLTEGRHLWAGFAGRDTLLSPDRDMALEISGEDLLHVAASAGVLIAPPEIPFEFALAGTFEDAQRFTSTNLSIEATSLNAYPSADADFAEAKLALPRHYVLRGGARYLGERLFVEIGTEISRVPQAALPQWSIQGLEVVDQSGASASVQHIATSIARRSNVALRGAIDYEAVPGYLWLTAGYAYATPSSPKNKRNANDAELGGHTLALGLESTYQDYTLTFGYARQLRARSVVLPKDAEAVFNPFEGGTAAANSGEYSQSSDRVGFAIEISFR